MKTTYQFLAIIILAFPASAAEIRIEECPPAVQATIQQNSRSGLIEEVESYAIQGKTLYVAEVELPMDRELKIHVAADGALMKTREDTALAEVPEAVRSTVRSKIAGGSVDDVEKLVVGQTVTFHIEIGRKSAPDLELVIDAEGKILSEREDADD